MLPTEPVALDIQVDRSKITLGDMRFISKMANKANDAEGMERMFDMLERIVIGGIEHIPFDALPTLMAAVSAALNPETEIKN